MLVNLKKKKENLSLAWCSIFALKSHHFLCFLFIINFYILFSSLLSILPHLSIHFLFYLFLGDWPKQESQLIYDCSWALLTLSHLCKTLNQISQSFIHWPPPSLVYVCMCVLRDAHQQSSSSNFSNTKNKTKSQKIPSTKSHICLSMLPKNQFWVIGIDRNQNCDIENQIKKKNLHY